MKRSLRVALMVVLMVAGGVSVGVLGVIGVPRALRGMSFFRVRAVEVDGARYTDPSAIVARLHIDTTASVWDDLSPYEARIRGMPELRAVDVRRKLPATIVVEVTERTPVALVPGEGAAGSGHADGSLAAYDASGAILPIDVTRADVDVPIVDRADLAALRLLDALRTDEPGVFARVSGVRRAGVGVGVGGGGSTGDFILTMPGYTVRAEPNVAATRFAELGPVMADLARRHITPMEIDLRFRDQVVVRR